MECLGPLKFTRVISKNFASAICACLCKVIVDVLTGSLREARHGPRCGELVACAAGLAQSLCLCEPFL